MSTRPDPPHPLRGIDVSIPPHGLGAILTMPPVARGIVLFAHGSGSSRFSPRNRFVAAGLHAAGFGTLLFDLLTRRDDADRGNVFGIPRLAARLAMATDWLATRPEAAAMPLGYFGASTGAAAALVASTMTSVPIAAVVSRRGRPDLAGPALARVTAPTLLAIGGEDRPVVARNRDAVARLREHLVGPAAGPGNA